MTSVKNQSRTNYRRPPFLNISDTSWADEQLRKLSLEQKIAQLLHVAAYSNRDQAHLDYLQELVEEEDIGGLIFFQGNPRAQAQMTNNLQAKAKMPLLISIDGEWGLAMRLNDTIAFPYQLALGAINQDKNDLIYEMGRQIGKQCKALGIHVNFAPTVDINSNPANPVIGFRSFGEDKHLVAEKALAYMQGMQDEGILACAKHFPGHGDTDSDSHFTLPLINHSKAYLHENELYPFQKLLDHGVGSIMTAHLNVPALESEKGVPSTLSHSIVTDLLKREMGFEGLVFTDALDMKGVSSNYVPGEIETKALLAGNDLLLFTVDVAKAKKGIVDAVEQGLITEKEIEERCYKQLLAKQWAGLDNYQSIDEKVLESEMHNRTAIELNQKLAEQAITMFAAREGFSPIKEAEELILFNVFGDPDAEVKLVEAFDASLMHHFKGKKAENIEDGLNDESHTLFTKLLQEHCSAKVLDFFYKDKAKAKGISAKKVVGRKVIALHLTGMKTASGFGVTETMHQLINDYCNDSDAFFIVFGNVYALNVLEPLKKAKNLLLCYQDSKEMQKAAFSVLVGEIEAKGKLPVNIA